MATHVSSRGKSIPEELLALGTAAVFVAWLAVACYAIAYFVSH